ncbi:uncharacterized protein BDZ99DRAFT_476685 [Mytilinidion resinicola]|uniref:Uncharacterized protein n=1 Tax=Mytilinidion resinicola TaxID=574789 RepID=A0A6A6YPQ4_9PEZI|nr:uncharacterized protein BDZ99DRAFT_476685 [Mytilinidion resinicola]KAF2810533.1 hypothetical protein BDZ99DRAFT_476685 [Mytilinidion resinicola]
MEYHSTILPRAPQCGYQGNADLYGLGVRLGLYFQLFAATLVAQCLPASRNRRFFRIASAALGASTFIVLAMQTAKQQVFGVEVNTILWVLGLQLMGTATPPSAIAIDIFALAKSMLLYFPLAIYQLWFFFHGLDVLPRTECPDEYAFFFAKVSLWHWFRKLSEAFSILMILGYTLFFALIVSARKEFNEAGEASAELQAAWSSKHPFRQLLGAIMYYAFASIFTILPAELTIKWNKVKGVNRIDSVSQLVPFVLGLGQLLDVLYRIVKKMSGHNPEEVEDAEGEDANARCPVRDRHTSASASSKEPSKGAGEEHELLDRHSND